MAAVSLICAACGRLPGVYVFEADTNLVQGAAAFDAKSYVDGIWSSKVLPTARDKALQTTVVLDAIAADPSAAGKQYGRQQGTGSPYAFLIKGAGPVTAAPSGPLTVDVGVAGAPRLVTIATGPVFTGTALRDAVGFLDFSQFTNQIDYADVATQLNARVRTDVVARLDRTRLAGKQVEFVGAFSLLSPADIVVVPTELTVM